MPVRSILPALVLVVLAASPERDEPAVGSTVMKGNRTAESMVDGLPRSPSTDRYQARLVVIADSVFPVPSRGQTARVGITVRITNTGPATLRFNLIDTIHVWLRSASGDVLPMDGGRGITLPGPTVSDPLTPGSSLTIDRSAEVAWTSDSNLRLSGDDGFGGIWYVDGLEPGTYQLNVDYENNLSRGGGEVPIWVGKVTASHVEIEVRR